MTLIERYEAHGPSPTLELLRSLPKDVQQSVHLDAIMDRHYGTPITHILRRRLILGVRHAEQST